MSKAKIAIVGGGIGGLLSAIHLSQTFDVTIFEAAEEVGGLLRSKMLENGALYDHGTHILETTNNAEINRTVFESLPKESWSRFSDLKAHTFYKKLCLESPFPDARVLPEKIYKQGLLELLDKNRAVELTESGTLYDYSVAKFGETFTKHLIAPAVYKQLLTPLDKLPFNSPFAIKRIVCADMKQSQKWKSDPYFDERIAFPSTSKGSEQRLMLYPRSEGIQCWVDNLKNKLEASGVAISTGAQITAFNQKKDGILIDFRNSEKKLFSKVIWTLPVHPLLSITGIASEQVMAPQINMVKLVHLEFDRCFKCDSHYVTNYDENFKVFRVTLYPNFRKEEQRAIATVEIIQPATETLDADVSGVCQELADMGVIEKQAKCIFSDVSAAPSGFPVITDELVIWSQKKCSQINALFPDLLLSNKARAKHFFMQDVIAESFQWDFKLSSLKSVEEALVSG